MLGSNDSSLRQLFAIGPASGGVGHGFKLTTRAVAMRGWRVNAIRPSEAVCAARSAAGLVWRNRREMRRADAVHIEFGSNDRAAFWCALFAVMLRGDCTVFIHDYPKLIHTPAIGLLNVRLRPFSVFGYRILAPLIDPILKTIVLRRAGSIVVMSSVAKQGWQPRTHAEIVVIPHGDEAVIADARWPSQGTHVLFAGFLGRGKGIDILIQAWEHVGAESPIPLVIAGAANEADHSWLEPIRARSAELPSPPEWLGPVAEERDFQRLFADAAVVVLPYRTSSPASGILVRSMVQGRCIVASRVPAVAAAVRDGVDGLLIEPGDAAALAKSLRSVLASPETRDVLGAAASTRAAELFSWAAHAKGLERAYELAGRGAS